MRSALPIDEHVFASDHKSHHRRPGGTPGHLNITRGQVWVPGNVSPWVKVVLWRQSGHILLTISSLLWLVLYVRVDMLPRAICAVKLSTFFFVPNKYLHFVGSAK